MRLLLLLELELQNYSRRDPSTTTYLTFLTVAKRRLKVAGGYRAKVDCLMSLDGHLGFIMNIASSTWIYDRCRMNVRMWMT